MFETKTREQENGAFPPASRTRGGGAGGGGLDSGSDAEEQTDGLRFTKYQRARPAAGNGLLHRRAPSRESQA